MKWIKLTDKEPKFGEQYLVANQSILFIGKLKEKLIREDTNEYLFYDTETLGCMPDATHYMKIELPKE